MTLLRTNVAIVGGGVAGLWLAARLRAAGVPFVLLERDRLGATQTIGAQGIIHGGVKYALSGTASRASATIAPMPQRWADCLAGSGELDLRATRVLSTSQVLWTTTGLVSRLAAALASKALRTPGRKLDPDRCSPVLARARNAGHAINVYEVEETVIDPASLLTNLAELAGDALVALSPDAELRFDAAASTSSAATVRTTGRDGRPLQIQARAVVFTAGEANADLARAWLGPTADTEALMQRRPLHMVVAHDTDAGDPHLGELFGHCLGPSNLPRVTITTQRDEHGRFVWAIGGQPAERGVELQPAEQVDAVRAELGACMPWLDLSRLHFTTHRWTRAEGRTPDGQRPDEPVVRDLSRDGACALAAWPTKMAFAPLLADRVIEALAQHDAAITRPAAHDDDTRAALAGLPAPTVAPLPWNELDAPHDH